MSDEQEENCGRGRGKHQEDSKEQVFRGTKVSI